MQKKVQELLKKLAEKHELPVQVVERIYYSQWQKLKEAINSLEYKTIKLPSFGKYVTSKVKLKKRSEYYDLKKETRELERLQKLKDGNKEQQGNQDNAIQGTE